MVFLVHPSVAGTRLAHFGSKGHPKKAKSSPVSAEIPSKHWPLCRLWLRPVRGQSLPPSQVCGAL